MKKEYKRKYRELSPRTREKISRAMKGKKRSDKTKMLISQSMKNYWLSVESKNTARETFSVLKIKIKGVRFFLTPCLSWGFPLQISIVGIPARSLFAQYHGVWSEFCPLHFHQIACNGNALKWFAHTT